MKRSRSQFEILLTAQDKGGYTAEVPDLPGCVSEGENIEETVKNIREAIELYLQTLKERRIALPQREPERMLRILMTV